MYKELRAELENTHRLNALQRTHLMDSPPEESFDRLTRLAARILHVPVALISLVDDRRQFFKSCIGLPPPWSTQRETPLSHSFCQYVVHSHLPLIINDAREHPVLRDNRAVTELGVIAYAGIPIRTAEGLVLGSFCVIDTEPRVWTKEEIEILTELTNSVLTEIELGAAIQETIQRTSEVVASEARTRVILNSALDCIITMDASDIILEFNPAAERIFGYREEEVVGKRMAELIIPPYLREAHKAGMSRYLACGESHVLGKRIEITAMHSDGTEFPVELAISVSNEPQPMFTAYIRDITETRQAANAIERSRTMLESIQRAQRQFIAEGDARATFNDLLLNLLSLTESEYGFIGEILYNEDSQPYLKTHSITNISWNKETRDFYAQHERAGLEFTNLKSLFGTVMTTGQRVIANAPGRDPRRGGLPPGHPSMDSFLGLPFYHGDEMVGMVGIANRPGGYDEELCAYLAPFLATCASLIAAFRVRKQRRQMQESLRVERDYVAAVLDTVGALVLVLGQKGKIVGFNRTCEEITGFSSEEAIGKFLWEMPFYPHEERPRAIQFWNELPEEWVPGTYENSWLSHNGEHRLLTWSYTTLRDSNGRITNMVACGIDITAQRESERALAQARQNEVEIGTKIQQTLLVRKPLENLCGFTIGTLSHASQGIDGDYFDFFSYDGTCFDFLIGDVMGKGVPAALLGAASKSHFQRAIRRLQIVTQEFGRLPAPEEILTAVHYTMSPELVSLDSFITLCYARFEPQSRCLRLIDCGHTRTIHYHADTQSCSLLQGDNLPLGVRSEEVFLSLHVPISPGDILFFYSDGVTEARDAQGEFFGEDRLLTTILRSVHLAPQDIVEHVHTYVASFTGKDNFADDLTCVAIRFDERTQPGRFTRIVREFTSSLRDLEAIRQFTRNFCRYITPAPLSEDTIHLITLALNEAVTNIIHHAYAGRDDQRIQIIAECSVEAITFRLQDGGRSFDATTPPEPDFDGNHDHGFGMFIISQCMDDVRYERDDLGRNCLTLVRHIAESDRMSHTESSFNHEI